MSYITLICHNLKLLIELCNNKLTAYFKHINNQLSLNKTIQIENIFQKFFLYKKI